jgi:ribulose-phosphate 3-epimerase
MVYIAPSILSADFARLGEQVREVDAAGAQRIHVDVMDGHFVPNLSMGPVVVKALRKVTRLPLEVHLMVEDPARFVDAFLHEGADTLLFHREVLPDPRPLLRQVHQRGKRAGLAINPEQDVGLLEPFLAEMDVALCMTVHPGFGGQHFLPESPERIRRLREMIVRQNPTCELEVDGGIDDQTLPVAARAGANVFVAGTAVYGAPAGPAAAVQDLHRRAVEEARA